MGVGPNMVLDKGMIVPKASVTYQRGLIVVETAAEASGQCVSLATAGTNVTVATNIAPYFVVMEDLDSTRAATGKAVLDCRVLGIARVVAGAAVTQFARIVPDSAGKGIVSTRTAGGSVPVVVAGIALNAVAAAGQEFDMLVVPGLVW